MAITDFNFPGVELHQEFISQPVIGEGALNVCVVGQQYQLHRANVESEAALVPNSGSYVPGSNLTVNPIPGRTVVDITGGTPTYADIDGSTATQRLVVKEGLYMYNNVTTGFTADTGAKQITFNAPVRSGNGVTVDFTKFGTRGAQVGDVVEITNGTTTVATTIDAISEVDDEDNSQTVTLASVGSLATITGIKFMIGEETASFAAGSDATAPLYISGGTATIKGTLTTNTTKLGNNAITGTLWTDTDHKAKFYIEYREKINTGLNKVKVLTEYDELETKLGGVGIENPLALAAYFAMRGGSGTQVYVTTVSAETNAEYIRALGALESWEEIYSIVPVTSDASIIMDCASILKEQSNDPESKIRRALWYGLQYTGDDNDERVQNMIDRIVTAGNFRAVAVAATGVAKIDEVEIPNYILAAAPAGMRSYEPCHRPISNLGYDFFYVDEIFGFNRAQLKKAASNGIWLIGSNRDGVPINMRQLTTAASNDLNKDEESCVANLDEICLALCHAGEELTGCSNINPTLLALLSDRIHAIMDYRLTNRTSSAAIGPQITAWTLDALYQDPIARDHVYATITVDLPKPFNRFVITVMVM